MIVLIHNIETIEAGIMSPGLSELSPLECTGSHVLPCTNPISVCLLLTDGQLDGAVVFRLCK